MSDWQVGDLAVCVDAGWFCSCPCGKHHAAQPLREGAAYVVEGVTDFSSQNCRQPHLVILGSPKLAARFRKIHPDEHEACEPEFVTLLKRIKRKVGA